MRLHNEALMQAWRFMTESQSLCVRFLKAKYKVGEDVLSFVRGAVQKKPNWSYSWKSLLAACKQLSPGLKWRIGNGTSVNFLQDSWLERPLSEVYEWNHFTVEPEAKVCDHISQGLWNSELLFLHLPMEYAVEIISYPLPQCVR